MLRSALRIFCVLSVLAAVRAQAQTPLDATFTFQGELAASGAPVTGTYDVRFRLYDAASGGNQVGPTLCSNDLAVANGRFMASLDFGAAFAGQQRFLEIEVRADSGLDCSDAANFTVLAPRQALTAVPNATFARNADNAATAAAALTASNAASLNGQSPSYYQNAENLTGTLADARLSSNVARLNGNQTFTGLLNLTNAGNTFVGSGAGLTSLNGANIVPGTVARAALSADVQSGLGAVAPDLSLAAAVYSGSRPSSVAVSGSFAFVVSQNLNQLRVFNISNPALPTSIGLVQTGNAPNSVAVSGAFAYVVTDMSGTLEVYNISSPTPTLEGSVATGSNPNFVVVSGPFAYVVNRGSNTLQVFNISNPAAPTLTGSVSTGTSPSSVAVSGPFAYVVNASSNTLQVFNIGNPAAPTLVGTVQTGFVPRSVAVSGVLACVVNANEDTLQVFNIGSPSAPTLVGSVQTGLVPNFVTLSGSFAFVTAAGSRELQIFNISDPVTPRRVESAATDTNPVCVALSGSFAYVVNFSTGSLQVFNAPLSVDFSLPLASSVVMNVSAGNIITGTLANERTTGTSLNTPGTLVLRDASGGFSAGAVAAASFAGNGSALSNLDAGNISAGTLANARTTGTNLNTPGTLVLRNGSGGFSAGAISAASISGDGAFLVNLNAAGIGFGLLDAARLPDGGDWSLASNLNIANGTLVINPTTGRVGLGTLSPDQRLSVNGNASKSGGGSWATFSDARLKHDVRPLEGTLDRLLQLRGVSFFYNDPASINELGGERIGMIAQEVERVFPDWVEQTPRGYKALTFRGFEALTVEALRDLRAEKDAVAAKAEAAREEIEALKTENAELKARLERLERALEAMTPIK